MENLDDRGRHVEDSQTHRESSGDSADATSSFEALKTSIMEPERMRWRDFFGMEIDVPPLPDSITPERYERWRHQKFELHYLPPQEMSGDKQYPGWEKKPGNEYTPDGDKGISFLRAAEHSLHGLTPDNLKLPGAWILIDTRDKPGYNQDYQDDGDIGSALRELRNSKIILPHDKGKDDSRCDISWEELHKPEVTAKFAKVLGVEPSQVRLPRAIEENVLGNACYKQWDTTDTYEWSEDSYNLSFFVPTHLIQGDSNLGGISDVFWSGSGNRDNRVGFRLAAVLH